MNSPLITQQLTKGYQYGSRQALHGLTLEIPAQRIVGLLGRNGAGKSTLLHIACGLVLPTQGTCTTLGKPCGDLDAAELAQIGLVSQEARFLEWMTVEQQLRYQASFYPNWDTAREKHLVDTLALDRSRKIVQLSTGDRQKVGLILATCHHPQLLLLDEPVSTLDPIVRESAMAFLLDVLREDGSTIVISSHLLADVERFVDWIVCLDEGRLALSTALDAVHESYAEWIVSTSGAALPAHFPEPWILAQQISGTQARLSVRTPSAAEQARFAQAHGVKITVNPMNLERLFPLLTRERKEAA